MFDYLLPYLLIMAHFASGVFWLILINRKITTVSKREQWTKFIVYVLLFNLIWYSIVSSDSLFPLFGYLLIALGSWEWWKATRKNRYKIWLIIVFIIVMAGFWRFLYLGKNEILFTFFVVVLFDGSCQIAGQLIGKRPLAPKISPRKTVEGLFGGALITLATSFLVKGAFSLGWIELILITGLILITAGVGDLLASLVKRNANIETYSNLIPGHGGILDRFDSLFLAGSAVYLFMEFTHFFPWTTM